MPRSPRAAVSALRTNRPVGSIPRFPGIPISVGGIEYIVPPLSIHAFAAHREKIAAAETADDGLPNVGKIEDLLEVCLAAMRRNYPALTLEELLDAVDLVTLPRLLKAALGQGAAS